MDLNKMDFITSKQMHNDALQLFNIEITETKRGLLIFVIDGKGNSILHPMKMLYFEERPMVYQLIGKSEKIGQSDSDTKEILNHSKEVQGNYNMLFNLLILIPNYLNKNNFRKKGLIKNKRKNWQRS